MFNHQVAKLLKIYHSPLYLAHLSLWGLAKSAVGIAHTLHTLCLFQASFPRELCCCQCCHWVQHVNDLLFLFSQTIVRKVATWEYILVSFFFSLPRNPKIPKAFFIELKCIYKLQAHQSSKYRWHLVLWQFYLIEIKFQWNCKYRPEVCHKKTLLNVLGMIHTSPPILIGILRKDQVIFPLSRIQAVFYEISEVVNHLLCDYQQLLIC